jgi:hypothetical protein
MDKPAQGAANAAPAGVHAPLTANAGPAGLHAPLTANAVAAGVHAPLTANAVAAGVHQSQHHAAAGASQRPRCENDGSCYRQNPAHWADFHHANQHAPVDKPVQGAAK